MEGEEVGGVDVGGGGVGFGGVEEVEGAYESVSLEEGWAVEEVRLLILTNRY